MTLIDCDIGGRLSLKRLKELPLGDYDGVVFTNVFAAHAEWDEIRNFCIENKKSLIIDNATGLLDRPQINQEVNLPMEAISAHHTKPWGVGEGGFVICNKDEAKIISSLINFGLELPLHTQVFSGNYKMSEIAAAAIYDRLERFEHWRIFYDMQARRLKSVVNDANVGITELNPAVVPKSPVAHVPFLAPRAITKKDIQDCNSFVIRKYYSPIRNERNLEKNFRSQRKYSVASFLSQHLLK